MIRKDKDKKKKSPKKDSEEGKARNKKKVMTKPKNKYPTKNLLEEELF